MLVLGRAEVAELLDVDALVDALAGAMADLSAGRASVPARVGAEVAEHDGRLLSMPGYVPSQRALVTKLVSLFPRNAGTALPTHQAVVVVFDAETGAPSALLDGTGITAVRTAACSALATRLLARDDAAVLAVLGTGVQARAHARALTRVRPLREVRIAGHDAGRTAAAATELAAELGLEVRAVTGPAEACAGADVVCATTHPGADPLVRRELLDPGAHVVSVGWDPAGREVDDATVRDALVVVESRTAAAGSPDLSAATVEDLPELGELVAGTRPGRTSGEQLTLYKSVGVAVQDATAATLVLAAARERGAGREVEL
ncbi:ornithine cyclodeaminase family protein [Blastococcus sp. SYSU D00669]